MKTTRPAVMATVMLAVAVLAGCQQRGDAPPLEVAIDHYVRGQLLAVQGDDTAALIELARCVDTGANLAVAHAAMGDIYRKRGDYAMAAVSYERACEANPYNFRNHYNLGVIRQALAAAAQSADDVRRELTLAAEVYVRAITLKPKDCSAHLNLAVCYYQLGRLEDAERYCLRAIELDPSAPSGHTNLGAVYDAQSRPHDAIAEYKKSLELDTNQPRVLVNLGTAYMNQERFSTAVHEFELAAQMDPALTVALERKAYCHYRLGEHDAAIAAYQAALAADPNLADAHRGLGVVYMTQYLRDLARADLRDQALAAWNRSLELQPDQPKLQAMVQKYTPRQTPPER